MTEHTTYKGRKNCHVEIVTGLANSTRFNESLNSVVAGRDVEDIKITVSPNGETNVLVVYVDNGT